jgi:hypothetical protein
MLAAILLAVAVAALQLFSHLADHYLASRAQFRLIAKVGIALVGCLLAGLYAFRTARSAAAAQSAEAALMQQVKQQQRELTQASSAASDCELAAQHSAVGCAQALQACQSSFEKGNEVASFLVQLPSAKREALTGQSCGPPPPYRFGGAQIRLVTATSLAEANDRMDHLMNVLQHTADQTWSAHVTHPVQSLLQLARRKSRPVWVITLNNVEPALESAACDWLKCMGVEAGAEKCGARNLQAALGALGSWPHD